MPILIDEKTGLFTLHTKNSTYQMQAGPYGYLLHLYYGRRVENASFSYLLCPGDHGFSGNPHDTGKDRTFSLDFFPQEYPTLGTGDFRLPCLDVEWENGAHAVDLRYESYELFPGKPGLPGLPGLYCNEKEEAQTLKITLKDRVSLLRVHLLYSVFAEQDAIARSCLVENGTGETVRLDAALSGCLDFLEDGFELISFYGRHAGERSEERTPLHHGRIAVESRRGVSSHQQNPFVILCEPNADEDKGQCWGVSLLYSGNFCISAEDDQYGQTRLSAGIAPDGFRWELPPGKSFQTPETVLCYSAQGLGGLSRQYHRLYRKNLCRGRFRDARRPILVNNWEATYFQFNEEKLYQIAQAAAELGVEMLVVDDGWFGKRDSDETGLGDWAVNENKLRGGMRELCRRVNGLGLKVGLWFEPEMVSEDSGLYRAHPEWALQIPGRPGVRSRYQYVLDMSRADVVESLFQSISGVLSSAHIEYVKWDMNRHLTDIWSAALPAGRQGEVCHRYVLGVYDLMERLTCAFPDILFEGCSGGGGRFDAGMLYYTPQIWCSDNTDALDRIRIQHGTSFGYPVCAMGSHVSACPNHQTGRTVPLKTRGVVAMAGTFGYELDLSKLSKEEKDEMKRQIAFYQRYYEVINHGDYYRLTNPSSQSLYAAWQFVSQDGAHSLVSFVLLQPRYNISAVYLKLRGLEPGARYRVCVDGGEPHAFMGGALMYAGLMLPPQSGDDTALQIELERL